MQIILALFSKLAPQSDMSKMDDGWVAMAATTQQLLGLLGTNHYHFITVHTISSSCAGDMLVDNKNNQVEMDLVNGFKVLGYLLTQLKGNCCDVYMVDALASLATSIWSNGTLMVMVAMLMVSTVMLMVM